MDNSKEGQRRRGLITLAIVLLVLGAVANIAFRGAYQPPLVIKSSMTPDEQLALLKQAKESSRSVRLEGEFGAPVNSGATLITKRRGIESKREIWYLPLSDTFSITFVGDISGLKAPVTALVQGSRDFASEDAVQRKLRPLSSHDLFLKVQSDLDRTSRMAVLAAPLVGGVGICGYLFAKRRRAPRQVPLGADLFPAT